MFLWRIRGSRVEQAKRRVLGPELRRLARQYHVHAKRNADIAVALQRRFAALHILIAWRARKRRPAQRIEPIDASEQSESLDPITLDKPEPPYFDYRQSNGKHKRYTARTLLDYMLASNKFNEPMSNLPFSDTDLAALDAISVAQGWRLPSLVERRRSRVPGEARLEEDIARIVELEMQTCIAALAHDQAYPWLVRDHLLDFTELVAEMRQYSPREARICLATCIAQFRSLVDPTFPPSAMLLAVLHNLQD